MTEKHRNRWLAEKVMEWRISRLAKHGVMPTMGDFAVAAGISRARLSALLCGAKAGRKTITAIAKMTKAPAAEVVRNLAVSRENPVDAQATGT